jgi:alditol oxidase
MQYLGTFLKDNFISYARKQGRKIRGLKNWAGNYTYKADDIRYPQTVEELAKILKAQTKWKALGTQHCFNNIADTSGMQLSTKNLNSIIELNQESSYVIVESGIKYGQLGKHLHSKGWALHNLASLPHISVGGSCATATHGSGVKNGNLATALKGFELLTPGGDLLWVDPKTNTDLFYAGGVSMGALGIMTKVKLAIQPTFAVSQRVYENLPMDALKDNFDTIMSVGYSVSFFTHWLDKNINQVWVKSREDARGEIPSDFYGATPATGDLHPIKFNSPVNCTPQMGMPGPWHERLPHFKMDFTPSNGDELQSEFFVARENAYEAIMAVEALHDKIAPLLFVTEIRCIAADNFWMSTAYQRESVAIHFTWKSDTLKVLAVLPEIQAVLKPFGARPHWGKIFTLPAEELIPLYPKFQDFLYLKSKLDPEGILNNTYLNKALKIT